MITLIKHVQITNEGSTFQGSVVIENEMISAVYSDNNPEIKADNIIDGKGKWLIPGIIDDQVHFREPGLTHKGDIFSESRAAASGGITSFMEMPNTIPQTTTNSLLNEKFNIAADKSLVNYSFYLGADNNNIDEISKINPQRTPGVKIFLGSSTGNMLVNDERIIKNIFENSPVLCAIHSEDDLIINSNLKKYQGLYGDEIPFYFHPSIRTREACFKSTQKAVEIASKTNCRLHILHISTYDELSLLSDKPLKEKKITSEVCVHHLWFNSDDYGKYGAKIKWNPAIKDEKDRTELISGLKSGKIDIVATDHAPHTISEKNNNYINAPSGGPLVQHSLQAMIELSNKNYFSKEEIIKFMCHQPADLFGIVKRGYIKEGYYADLVLVDLDVETEVNKNNILYKCGWSPFEGQKFNSKILYTFVNGKIVYDNGKIIESNSAKALEFDR